MTIFSIDNIFDETKLHDIYDQLSKVDGNKSLVDELQSYVQDQVKLLKDFKYAIDQSTTITMSDPKGQIKYVDDNFCKITGYSKDELLNRTHRVINSGYHDSAFFKDLWDTILAGHVWNGEIKIRAKDASLIWLSTTIVPILHDDGTVHAFIAFRNDITEKKNIEEQLVEALNNDYRRVLQELMNLVFRVKMSDTDEGYYFTMVEGKLAKKIAFSNGMVFDQNLQIKSLLIQEKLDQVFRGEQVTFKYKIGDLSLYTMLSPIMEGDQVVEVIGSSVDITSLEEAEEQIKYFAYTDPLTNLPNRSKFRSDLESHLEKRDQYPFSVLLCDIDRLKYINDALGEFAGDKVIAVVAKRLEEILGDQGELYRYGGDEFIAIMHGSHQQVDLISDEMIKSIKKPIPIASKEFYVTSTIGISNHKQTGITPDELIHHASAAVHYGKVSGRNSKLFYSPNMNKKYNSLILLEGEIRAALHKNEFMLHYQPKVNVVTGEIIGMEALVRWFHKERGYIPPNDFIPLTEETGLIIQLGEWVIRQACKQHVEWMDKGMDPFSIAVNVSAIELQRNDFAEKVFRIIEETGMDPSHLVIEITENSVMQNTEDCINTMNKLRERGISLSIDDFGTGYSSFGYLRKFPINYLKIDQSFIKNALTDASNAEIVKAMIQIAHTFGLKVVAEGVEDPEILSFIGTQQCDYYQGYFFSEPLPPLEIEKLMTVKSN
ncbi:EAL domain-containing protein [Aquibacillus koreensis]|uniref:EAL domain-containing protein n=1 Tax=Aquibacillus koreensis TaxID=279446 RepID=A0A9X4AKU3_9BACI|nr:EAL domain-containing protein [Aquibacillus koreensis]MCT2534441.1 EAL domain-containing protein [Aquibacillus koreensis]MDC3421748.1 EAL domain-containing protein [Aquibacillus koreensis]